MGVTGHRSLPRNANAECVCLVCGSTFTAKNRKAIVCSPDCKRQRKTELEQTRRAAPTTYLPSLRECTVCGQDFSPSNLEHRLARHTFDIRNLTTA